MSTKHLRIFRVLRLARLLRGIRFMRLVKFLASLRALLLGIIEAIRSAIWATILMVFIFYGFSVMLTQAAVDYCREESILAAGDWNAVPHCTSAGLNAFWSNVPLSIFTLLKAISGGVSWHDVVTPLAEISWIPVTFFVLYICIMFFVILNVITGIFCQNAIDSANSDKDLSVMTQLMNQESYVEKLKHIFYEIDDDGSNFITINEFEYAMRDERMSAFLSTIDIEISDAWTLFTLLDEDLSGFIDLEEFVSGCLLLKGSAKAIHLAKLSHESRLSRRMLGDLEDCVLSLHQLVEDVLGDRVS
eukprot:TRINITY_DN6859_c0_g1_i1.p1 TRINITY_DN6859_c0_g1~~TRINITY_DN6859_c0_g1_i1.p1  ORF type:complete len:321 (+),score=41.65 TRINITY_DN6859_c0_g1_i1:57-965(+)